MDYRTQLESLTTLSMSAITRACAGEGLNALLTQCYDEYLELRELAEEALTDTTPETHEYYMQEAAAWRDTARVLNELRAEQSAAARAAESA